MARHDRTSILENKWFPSGKHLGFLTLLVLLGNNLYNFSKNFIQTTSMTMTQTFRLSDKAIGNPLMGYAPSAQETSVSEDVHLMYMSISWKELEPEKGAYQWEKIENTNQFKRWKSEGKKLVLRFILDYPEASAHSDIPYWLSREVDDLGDPYESEYGQGFSPNYANPTILRYYQQAVEAMGQRWGDDDFIAYIELGGLGHWGEWHVHPDVGIRPLPGKEIRKQYISPFQTAFPHANLLLRRPFDTGLEGQFGLYNDVFGNQRETSTWLGWIRSGGVYDQTGEEGALIPMTEAWKQSPIGGELTSDRSMANLMGSQLSQLLEQARDAHLSFLGPKVAEEIDGNQEGYQSLLKTMGYRLWVSSVRMKGNREGMTIDMTLNNSGTAPMYRDWPLVLYLCDAAGHTLKTIPLEVDFRSLLPGEQKTIQTRLRDFDDRASQVKVAVLSPETGEPAIHFAMDGLEDEVSPSLLSW